MFLFVISFYFHFLSIFTMTSMGHHTFLSHDQEINLLIDNKIKTFFIDKSLIEPTLQKKLYIKGYGRRF